MSRDLFMPAPPAGSVLEVVALSGGKDSTALALELKRRNPETKYTYVLTPTGNELPEMFEHWRRLGDVLQTPLTPVVHPRGLAGLIADQDALPNWRQRWCTRLLKIEPYAAWLMHQTRIFERVISHVGLRADEAEREGGDYADVPGVEMRFDMREWGWGIEEVRTCLVEHGVTIPYRTDCAVCFFQTLGEWYSLYVNHPLIYWAGSQQEESTGHTFRSPGRDTWPASLKELASEFDKDRIPKPKRDPLAAMKCRVCRA